MLHGPVGWSVTPPARAHSWNASRAAWYVLALNQFCPENPSVAPLAAPLAVVLAPNIHSRRKTLTGGGTPQRYGLG